MVEDKRSENWRGVRIGANVFVPGSSEGKIEIWSGLFYEKDDELVTFPEDSCIRDGYTHVSTDNA
jgi:hypothetical protein